jgi:hypothetical protein
LDYGFGLALDTFEGRVRVSHGGAVPGFTSVLVWFPEEKIAVAVLMNLNDPSDDRASDVTDAIAHSLFGQNGTIRAGTAPAATPAQVRELWAISRRDAAVPNPAAAHPLTVEGHREVALASSAIAPPSAPLTANGLVREEGAECGAGRLCKLRRPR